MIRNSGSLLGTNDSPTFAIGMDASRTMIEIANDGLIAKAHWKNLTKSLDHG